MNLTTPGASLPIRAVVAHQKKLAATNNIPKSLKLNQEMEKRRKIIVKSFSLARNIYNNSGNLRISGKESELEAGAEFLESNTVLSEQQEKRLKQMGATVRNGSSYMERMKLNEEREGLARKVMGKMSVDQLYDLSSFYHMMGKICSEVLENKLRDLVYEVGP
ncbi:unnamed protein product [Cuscuta epithymum]|uniref:Uncharacterized protein n=1 Tax=Cuscuta epithymum TaxID=186058 RepID=A0AAV0E7P0_9ASTE|nr:unnamed protein product [Cuscuta epithymum]